MVGITGSNPDGQRAINTGKACGWLANGPQRVTQHATYRGSYSQKQRLHFGEQRKSRLLGASGVRSGARSCVALQELQGLLIELLDLLIDGRVRTPFKDQQLGTGDTTLQLIRETRGGQLVGASER